MTVWLREGPTVDKFFYIALLFSTVCQTFVLENWKRMRVRVALGTIWRYLWFTHTHTRHRKLLSGQYTLDTRHCTSCPSGESSVKMTSPACTSAPQTILSQPTSPPCRLWLPGAMWVVWSVILWYAVFNVQSAMRCVQCAVCRVNCAVCSVQCAVCSVQCAVCSVLKLPSFAVRL